MNIEPPTEMVSEEEMRQLQEDWGSPPYGELLYAFIKADFWEPKQQKLFPELAFPIYKQYMDSGVFTEQSAYIETKRQWEEMKRYPHLEKEITKKRQNFISEMQRRRQQEINWHHSAAKGGPNHSWGGKSRKVRRNRKQKRKQTRRA
jgi:hypothetical protein